MLLLPYPTLGFLVCNPLDFVCLSVNKFFIVALLDSNVASRSVFYIKIVNSNCGVTRYKFRKNKLYVF